MKPSFCRPGGVCVAGWAELQSEVAEGLCIQAEGENTSEETGGFFFTLFFWCQRKSVWCASSSRKCIDVRHRHSSPPPAERLTLACPRLFFFFNVPAQETCKVNTVGLHLAHVGREILPLVFTANTQRSNTHTSRSIEKIGSRFLWHWCGRKKFLLVSLGTYVKEFSK